MKLLFEVSFHRLMFFYFKSHEIFWCYLFGQMIKANNISLIQNHFVRIKFINPPITRICFPPLSKYFRFIGKSTVGRGVLNTVKSI